MTVMMGVSRSSTATTTPTGDVVYLARGTSNTAADALLSPEEHGVRLGADGELIGVTLISVKRLLEQDGCLTITVPRTVHMREDELGAVLD